MNLTNRISDKSKHWLKLTVRLLCIHLIQFIQRYPKLKYLVSSFVRKRPQLHARLFWLKTRNYSSNSPHIKDPKISPLQQSGQQLLVDITETYYNDLKTGIQRVVRGLLFELLQMTIPGFRVEPVYLSVENGSWHYKYARRYVSTLMNRPLEGQDEVVKAYNGDILITLDISSALVSSAISGLHFGWMNKGVKIYSQVHDLIPIQLPQVFPVGAEDFFSRWLKTIAHFNGFICVSQTVATDLSAWLEKNGEEQSHPYHILCSHHGADIESSAPSAASLIIRTLVLERISSRISFLMVGTIEPRKGYLQTIDSFSSLWAQGIDVNLIIVGKEGWKGLPDSICRTIPETTKRLRTHSELGKHLFWIENASDEYLEKIYAASSCLIAASEGEGFGLPLIEAARKGLPIIARDIPIFREVAGQHAYYFAGTDSTCLADAVKVWMSLYSAKNHPSSQSMPWLTWKQSAQNLINRLPLQKSNPQGLFLP